MKNNINNEKAKPKAKSNSFHININKEKEKNISEFKQRLNKAQNFIEYFAIIGLNPKYASENFLYSIDIEKTNLSNLLKPELLTKYPPINKSYIDIDENICELCFPKGLKISKFKKNPEPEVYKFLLGNSFYSIDYPLKYLICLKFYENLYQYKSLQKKLKYFNDNINTSFDKNINDFYQEIKLDINNNKKIKRKNSINNMKKITTKKKYFFTEINENDLKHYYIPKVICFISLKPHYKVQEKILYQIYNYCIMKQLKIPIEKLVLNILTNIPSPPRGKYVFQYNLINEFKKINIKSEKMNQIKNIDEDLIILFNYFNINNFLEIFKYTLFETKTIIFCSNINHLCSVINALISILYPFNYPFQVSSYVLEDAFILLESISPFILGINYKYHSNFFEEKKIELKSSNYLIIDLDHKEYIINSIEELPNIPKNIHKKLKTKLETILKKYNISNNNNITINEDEDEENTMSYAFYEFFVNILVNYSDFLNKDNLKKNFKISNLKVLFNIKEFIESHSFNERPFYKRLTETQMFTDFIFKKMIPKDTNDKLDILLFDENINKKNNEKIFKKKKPVSFLTSNEYNFRGVHKIPKVKELRPDELNKYKNKKYFLKNLSLGQDIIFTKNNYYFNYFLFPVFNQDFFLNPSEEFFSYHWTIQNISNDINRVNTDILSKSYIDMKEENSIDDDSMLDYIYLAYVECWGYSFWYQDISERDKRFNQLLHVLDKIKRQEIGLINVLFEMLNKFHEKEKMIKLYNKILEYKITPNSFIYSIVGQSLKSGVDVHEDVFNSYKNNINSKSSFILRTFKIEDEISILGNKINFANIQECEECGRKIDIKIICKDYKKMKKDSLWAQCPLCLNYIKPKLSVILGNELFPGNKQSNPNLILTKKTRFMVYSPYELKNRIKEIIEKEQFKLLNVDKFKLDYPDIFWNCIWYFQIYDLDYTIILPYQINIFKRITSNSGINSPPIITKIIRFDNKNKNNNDKNEDGNIIDDINQDIKDNINNIDENIVNKKNNNQIFIVHNIFSFKYIKGVFINDYDNIQKEGKIKVRNSSSSSRKKRLSMSDFFDIFEEEKIIKKNLSKSDKFSKNE